MIWPYVVLAVIFAFCLGAAGNELYYAKQRKAQQEAFNQLAGLLASAVVSWQMMAAQAKRTEKMN